MARPGKDSLDYFPLDTILDIRWEFLEAKHGLVGFGLLIKLLQEIYREGYFLYFDEKRLILFSWKIKVDKNFISNVINDSINIGLFDKKAYENYQILTSRGIQRRYFEASTRRKNINFLPEIMLIDVSAYKNLINVDINSVTQGVFDCNNREREREREIKKKVADKSATAPDLKSSKKSSKERKAFAHDSEAYRLSELLFGSILKNNPKSRMHSYQNGDREKTLQKWAVDMSLLIRKDKQEPSIVEEAISFATCDSFWGANILSGFKLRKNWDTLIRQMQGKQKGKSGNFAQPKSYDAAGRALEYL